MSTSNAWQDGMTEYRPGFSSAARRIHSPRREYGHSAGSEGALLKASMATCGSGGALRGGLRFGERGVGA